ncbi:nSTAND1 domain-containing NTPase [Candidatus Nitrotoga sp. AM1P]|uniref:nSTAND1 domain-containing NTPase n=1 Tax=Candidatus Nitrotoga sp. AM1P TaxID=2559597 RepID=UPI0010AF8618|nr:TIR domain-containing protein [Candidatus Nitrotoga sp. AM1P]BBJ22434.1 hypothetical protein W01_03610 [Candidatus Nitrotoga sp. AM1P]
MSRSRIFISHSSANNAAALALASWLEANGWSDCFLLDFDDNRGIATGERWMAALKKAADRCEAVICLVSPAWLQSDMCKAEFYLANFIGKRIFGVMAEKVSRSELPNQMTSVWQLCDLTHTDDPVSFTVEKLPKVSKTEVSFSHAGLEALANGLRKAGLDASTFLWPPEGQPERSPYPGLRALEEPDAAVFFGRDASIIRAIDQMRLVRERDVEQLFVILGASGAGKSSFLRAGLLPRLKRDSTHFLVLPTIRPERAAISGSQGLLNSLKGALATAGQPMNHAQVRAELASIGLAGVLRQIQPVQRIQQGMDRSGVPTDPTFIIPIDQAEELFATDGQEEAGQLVTYIDALHQHLLAAQFPNIGGQRLRVLFLLTIRSDSLPKLQEQPALQGMSPVLFSLPAMPVSEFKAVIEGPARRHTETVKSLVITPELTEQLIQDAQGADALPLLALTLEWLYREFTTAQGTRIGYEEYQKLGGVRGVIGAAVGHAFERPGQEPAIPAQRDEQERLLQQIFPYIATVDPDTGNWKRRVALRASLRQELPQADALVSRLIEQRLLLTDVRRVTDGGEPVEVVEVAHEALLRQWGMLERWLREFAEALSASELIRRSAHDWLRGDLDKVFLVHTAHRLDAAEAMFSDKRLAGRFEPVDGQYLAACRQRDKRELEERENQLRELSMQTSLLLTSAAEAAADADHFDQSLRLAVLAAKVSFLHPAHPSAIAVLVRAAESSTLHTIFANHKDRVNFASFSPDGKCVVTASRDCSARVWDAETGKTVGMPMMHDAEVISASFSPDGKRVVTVSDDTARVWDAETGKTVGLPMTHDSRVNSASFSPDGKHVVTASWDMTARVWDAETGKTVGSSMRHDNTINSASFSPDGKHVVTASSDHTARVWNAETGKVLGAPMEHKEWIKTASFSPDGKYVVTASEDKTARIWDATTGKAVGAPMEHDLPINSASFSPNGKCVVTASNDKTARVWNAETGKAVGLPMKHDRQVNIASFSSDGKRVVTASDDMTARVWDTETSNAVGVAMTHGDMVTFASFSPDGKRVVTASWDKTARIWDGDGGNAVGAPMKHDSTINSASFSPDGKYVVTASSDHTARVWNAETGKVVGAPMAHDSAVNSASFSHDGKRVVTASRNKTARIWDAETSKALGVPMVHDVGWVNSASFSPDGKRVVTASNDKTARVWDAETGKVVGVPMTHGDMVTFASFSPSGKRVVTASDDTARVWDSETGMAVSLEMTHESRINSVSFSPDGKYVVTASDGKRVATASQDNTARVWDAETGNAVGVSMTHDRAIYSASFSFDGKRVVTASRDHTARVWDAETGKAMGMPMTHGDAVTSASFSLDGKRVVTASQDKSAQLWNLYWSTFERPDELIAEVCLKKLHGNIRTLTPADVSAARILPESWIGNDVCDG